MRIALEKRRVIKRRNIGVPAFGKGMIITMGGNNGINVDDAAQAGMGVPPTPDLVQQGTAGVSHLIQII